jgi:hypothetical protein
MVIELLPTTRLKDCEHTADSVSSSVMVPILVYANLVRVEQINVSRSRCAMVAEKKKMDMNMNRQDVCLNQWHHYGKGV